MMSTSREATRESSDQGVLVRGISVVVPCRDAAPWIEEALDSLAAQTHPPQEVVVVDDGSADGSADLVASWAAQHAELPVVLLKRPRRGLQCTLSEAVAASSGELLCRLDADDQLAADYLERLSEGLAAHPGVAYAYPRMRLFGEAEGLYPTQEFSSAGLVFQGNFVCAGALVRRAAYDRAGGVADLPAWEDWDLWLRLLRNGDIGLLVPEAEYRWRRHGRTRNQLSWPQRRALRLRIWWRHRSLLVRFAPAAPALLLQRLLHPVRQQ
jgi:glycosyltransferase involved in cell wall biosynthesis